MPGNIRSSHVNELDLKTCLQAFSLNGIKCHFTVRHSVSCCRNLKEREIGILSLEDCRICSLKFLNFSTVCLGRALSRPLPGTPRGPAIKAAILIQRVCHHLFLQAVALARSSCLLHAGGLLPWDFPISGSFCHCFIPSIVCFLSFIFLLITIHFYTALPILNGFLLHVADFSPALSAHWSHALEALLSQLPHMVGSPDHVGMMPVRPELERSSNLGCSDMGYAWKGLKP